jgi:transposase
MKKQQIAEILEVDRRTVYNYLNDKVFGKNAVSAGRPEGSKKLSSFHGFINQKLEEDLYVSGEILFNKLCSLGYGGQTTILYDYLKDRREQLLAYAVMRYETVPGQQAQVDWAECGRVVENGIEKKRYCFVMKLGYSRRSYMEFTTSMKQPILFACMKRAFAYFGGIPLEILFDNMKTAFIFDHIKCQWVAHSKMLAFTAHYGFSPRRCRVRRPQTQGKVEREIRYLRSSFLPSLRLDNIDVKTVNNNKLNNMVSNWLKRVDQKVLRELGQSRQQRFEMDSSHLKALPVGFL